MDLPDEHRPQQPHVAVEEVGDHPPRQGGAVPDRQVHHQRRAGQPAGLPGDRLADRRVEGHRQALSHHRLVERGHALVDHHRGLAGHHLPDASGPRSTGRRAESWTRRLRPALPHGRSVPQGGSESHIGPSPVTATTSRRSPSVTLQHHPCLQPLTGTERTIDDRSLKSHAKPADHPVVGCSGSSQVRLLGARPASPGEPEGSFAVAGDEEAAHSALVQIADHADVDEESGLAAVGLHPRRRDGRPRPGQRLDGRNRWVGSPRGLTARRRPPPRPRRRPGRSRRSRLAACDGAPGPSDRRPQRPQPLERTRPQPCETTVSARPLLSGWLHPDLQSPPSRRP